MALTKEEKGFARKQIKAYRKVIKHFQETINNLEDKIAGRHTLAGSTLAIGVTENVSNYTGDTKKSKDS